MIKVKIIGAGGYGGCGLLELLLRHPQAQVTGVIDIADVGKPIGTLLPHLKDYYTLPICAPDDPSNFTDVDVVFCATPDGVGMTLAQKFLDKGIKFIDFSGDFRFNNPADYAGYASRIGRDGSHASRHLLDSAVYGLAELHRQELKTTSLVGNPGCFATSCILGMAPALKHRLIDSPTIICDCKTGVSGAGKKPSPGFHYPARYDSMNAYKLTGHQHVFEIKRELSIVGETDVNIVFTPQVVPMCRGILSTLYATVKQGITAETVMDAYSNFYQDEPFIRLFSSNDTVMTSSIRGTNFCYLTIKVDESCSSLLVVSHIDNLMKGQAGSAIQAMNVMFDVPETQGLNLPAQYP
ncbi:MAG: N-acetyl-gamma-glutamyl-phosphate reductase [Candidatus Auribacterota bacterium]|jgi:N-acetyl-gamma-glutamyl-phosphate reductase|nr:N-acetyl-gamma-glutamyl-phosphate reductase [Candidatus Auribacterota bacterium]